jgi:hypothetical protein
VNQSHIFGKPIMFLNNLKGQKEIMKKKMKEVHAKIYNIK